MEPWAHAIRDRLAELDISQREAARRTGIPEQRISDWLNGRGRPSDTNRGRLVAGLGIDPRLVAPEWLLPHLDAA